MSWIQIFAILAMAGPAQADAPLILKETPRPLSYRISFQAVCGARAYDVTFETFTNSRSRVVRATANGADAIFHSASGDMVSVVEGFAVTGVVPTGCDPATGDIRIDVQGYDPIPDGAVVHTFSSVMTPAGQR